LAGKSTRFVNEREITVDSPTAEPVVLRPYLIRRLPAPRFVRFSPIPGRGSGTHLRLCVFRI
jgi:hypothetical protein